jgi:hypothetical protein
MLMSLSLYGIHDAGREDLHVTCQHHDVDMVASQQVEESPLLLLARLRGHRQAVKGDPEAVRDAFERRVIADDDRDFAAQFTLLLPQEKVVQAVRFLRYQDSQPFHAIRVTDRPPHLQRFREPREFLLEFPAGSGEVLETQLHPHVEVPVSRVGILLTVENVEAPLVEEGARGRDEALAVGAVDQKQNSRHLGVPGVPVRGSQVGGVRAPARK